VLNSTRILHDCLTVLRYGFVCLRYVPRLRYVSTRLSGLAALHANIGTKRNRGGQRTTGRSRRELLKRASFDDQERKAVLSRAKVKELYQFQQKRTGLGLKYSNKSALPVPAFSESVLVPLRGSVRVSSYLFVRVCCRVNSRTSVYLAPVYLFGRVKFFSSTDPP